MRKAEADAEGQPLDTLLLRVPSNLRELQRRVYRRVTVPFDRFIAVKIWEGGAPAPDEPSWPLCSGRLSNVSVGGLLVEIRADQNPRLTVGDHVGVEITANVGRPPLLVEAQYRHCCLHAADRLGLGLQFIGLEHDLPGRSPIENVAEFVRTLQRETGFVE
jgi:c-di-GMP-binding flagellar brake protein YcgR